MDSCSSVLTGENQPAVLKVIDLYALQNGMKAERNLLFEAAITDGFFYLDLSHSSFRGILDNVDAVFDLSTIIFNHDDETKRLFDVDLISTMKTNGYKPKGRNIVNRDGARDGFESWALPRNGLLRLTEEPFPHTPCVAARMQSLGCLLHGLGAAAQTIFKSLSNTLSLEPGQRFENFHDPNRPSTDLLRLLKYHSTEIPIREGASPQTPHTDLGSLTFVFSATPGLQVLPHTSAAGINPGDLQDSDWVFVTPRQNCAVVNFGDCMTMLTSGLIKSALHRVGPPPGMAMNERFSFAYLMRPEDDTPLRPVESPLILSTSSSSEDSLSEYVTSREWLLRKFHALRAASGPAPGTDIMKNEVPTHNDEVITGGRAIIL